ncbi:MAG: T9SS type A sorting domain-containing protein [Bacteroidota bacterium]
MPKTPLLALLALSLSPAVPTAHPHTTHFNDCQTETGRNASVVFAPTSRLVLARSLQSWAWAGPGDEVAAVTQQGTCAGAIVWDGRSAVLPVWMDDPTTPQQDGYAEDDLLRFHAWDASSGDVFTGVRARYHPIADTRGTFSQDSVAVVDWLILVRSGTGRREAEEIAAAVLADLDAEPLLAAATTLPTEVVLEPGYPNPFRTAARLRYGLPVAADVQVAVFDSRGRRVARLADGRHPPGWYEAVLPADGLAGGVYLVRLRAGSAQAVQRVTLVR